VAGVGTFQQNDRHLGQRHSAGGKRHRAAVKQAVAPLLPGAQGFQHLGNQAFAVQVAAGLRHALGGALDRLQKEVIQVHHTPAVLPGHLGGNGGFARGAAAIQCNQQRAVGCRALAAWASAAAAWAAVCCLPPRGGTVQW